MTILKRISDLEAGIKNKRRDRVEKVTVIEIIGDGWVETWDLEEHTHTRVYDQDEPNIEAT